MRLTSAEFSIEREQMPLFRATVDAILRRQPPTSFDQEVEQKMNFRFIYDDRHQAIIGIEALGEIEQRHLDFFQKIAPTMTGHSQINLDEESLTPLKVR